MELKAPPADKANNRFAFKVLACAFVGIHVPLIGMLVYLYSVPGIPSTLRILFGILVLTLAAAGVTLLVLNRMMRPIQTGNKAIHAYITSWQLQPMPKHTNDELGVLFQQVEYLMFVLQKTVSERNRILDMAITSNEDFQESIRQFMLAREDAFISDDPSKMRAALEEALQTVQAKIQTATYILHTFEQPAPRAAVN